MARPKQKEQTALARRIQELRERAKLTQGELAERAGLSRNAVARWEIGDRSPRAELLPQLAAVLGCRVDDFFSEKISRKSGK